MIPQRFRNYYKSIPQRFCSHCKSFANHLRSDRKFMFSCLCLAATLTPHSAVLISYQSTHSITRNSTSRHVTSRHVTSRHVTSLRLTSHAPHPIALDQNWNKRRVTLFCNRLEFHDAESNGSANKKGEVKLADCEVKMLLRSQVGVHTRPYSFSLVLVHFCIFLPLHLLTFSRSHPLALPLSHFPTFSPAIKNLKSFLS
jgi:hypothetical protein